MLDNATLVPDTALLVPGAAGAAEVLPEVRAAAVAAVEALLAASPARVVVVAPGRADRMMPGPFAPTLAAAGIDDARLGWPLTAGDVHPDVTPTRVDGPASAVALALLARCGWSGPTTLAEVAPPGTEPLTVAPGRAAELAALGYGLASGPERVAFLVAGSFSARRGSDAPLEHDRRAAAVDGGMLADLADAGPDARVRLAGMAPDLAAELAVTAWAPWQLVLGAVPRRATVRAAVPHVSAPFGATYAVASWSTR
ncbi:hypothetical protein [Cellulomonas aerilata]|uniref:Extradiol ring-cleavage dioxygenase class III enzyme subunit B domain-containing protein n=1 Tax=Cellulomonas aerilata TaxID=515326 RepID=A0A512DGH2_9CELL|nr:hypothetical protein [Cellulomonas aerilata]GEO35589.1 hypothetical protein CAE01nite_33140 [Cellulomonas aerilata]